MRTGPSRRCGRSHTAIYRRKVVENRSSRQLSFWSGPNLLSIFQKIFEACSSSFRCDEELLLLMYIRKGRTKTKAIGGTIREYLSLIVMAGPQKQIPMQGRLLRADHDYNALLQSLLQG